jgi:hypothetical protein
MVLNICPEKLIFRDMHNHHHHHHQTVKWLNHGNPYSH